MRPRLFLQPLLLLTGILFLMTVAVSGQNTPLGTFEGMRLIKQYKESRNDTQRVQLLIKLSSYYVLKSGEEKIDIDTALLLARQAGTLSRQLHYPYGQENAIYWECRAYLESRVIAPVYPLLPQVSDTMRIQILLDVYDTQLFNPPPNASAAFLDSAFANAQQAMALSQSAGLENWQLLCRIRYANRYMQLQENAKAIATFRQVFDESLRRHFVFGMERTYFWMNMWGDRIAGAMDIMEEFNKKLIADHATLRDSALIGPTHLMLTNWMIFESRMLLYKGEGLRAIEILQQLRQFEKEYPPTFFDTYNMLVTAYQSVHQYEKALHYAFEAIHWLETKGNQHHEDHPYWAAGGLYSLSGNDSLALQYYRQALGLSRQKGVVPVERLSQYVQLLLRLKRPTEALHLMQDNISANDSNRIYDNHEKKQITEDLGNCYYALGRYEEAERQYLQSISLCESLHDFGFVLNAWLVISRFYTNTQQYDKARPYLEKLVNNKDVAQSPIEAKAETEHLLFVGDSAAGHYLAAIGHQNRYKALNDSIFTLARFKQLEEVKADYETAKKDQELLTKDKDLVHTRLLRNLFVGGAMLLVLLLGLLYSRYHLKQKSNKLLQSKQVVIEESNQQLQKLVAEKEWLVKEVHHRVKNNLQIVISLLNMQAQYLKDELALQAFGDASHRIRAISLIHQKLYQEENMAVINMPDYIRELVSFLADASQGMRVHFLMELDPVELDASQSVPVGLLLNEAITNAFKYAFPGKTAGTINISLKANGNQLELCIADTGKGLPPDFNPATSKTLGFQLMNILSEQLEGHLLVESKDGVVIRVCFEKTAALAV